MIELELNKNEYDYICKAQFINNKYKKIFCAKKHYNDKYLIIISENQAEMIRDLFSEQLQIVGFNEKYELTPEGKILESLVDKFFIG